MKGLRCSRTKPIGKATAGTGRLKKCRIERLIPWNVTSFLRSIEGLFELGDFDNPAQDGHATIDLCDAVVVEPLRPRDANEIRRETRARDLPVAFDRNSGGALGYRSRAFDDKIVCKPVQVSSLPLQAIDLAEIGAERVGPRQ